MQDSLHSFSVLSAMITPAVLISACGTLIFSTSTRLARIVDRVRELTRAIESASKDDEVDFPDERRAEADRQIAIHARRTKLIQHSLTSFYVALSLFVAATVTIGFVAVFNRVGWAPNVLGIVGTVFLFYGCVMLIAETRLALRSVNSEMEFTLMLRRKYQERRAIMLEAREEIERSG
jgi:threonine/homoserine/homoserine lactone efflux protein